MPAEAPRYAPAARLAQVKLILNGAEGASVPDLCERLEVGRQTAIRYLRALERAGEPLYAETVGRRKVWRLMPSARTGAITLTTAQMVALFLSRRVFDFLAGTGLKEDLDEVFETLEKTLKRRDFQAARNLDRKFYDINEAPHVYQGRLEHVNDIITALIREERLRVRYGSGGQPGPGKGKGTTSFLLDPYTLFVYKKGLYLAGFSHQHQELRRFSLDGFHEVDWLRGEAFEYPRDFHPASLAQGAFGLIGGAPVQVRLRFADSVAHFIRRRLWHPTQKIRAVPGGHGIELSMEVRGTIELTSWILGFGAKVEVLEPVSLRAEIAAEGRAIAAQHRPRGAGL
jgi:predicted DNA-binding transcriptional regulator YafY